MTAGESVEPRAEITIPPGFRIVVYDGRPVEFHLVRGVVEMAGTIRLLGDCVIRGPEA